MIIQLHELLHRASARFRSLRLWTSLAVCWCLCALLGFALFGLAPQLGWSWKWTWAALAGAGALAAVACVGVVQLTARNPRWIAQKIEATHPDLGSLLLSALELAPTARTRRLGYLHACVVRSAIEHGRQHDWSQATPTVQLRLAQLGSIVSLAALTAACMLLFNGRHAVANLDASTKIDPSVIAGAGDFDVTVDPGDVELERGTTLVVVAKFGNVVPPEAQLIVADADASLASDSVAAEASSEELLVDDEAADAVVARTMSRSLDDPQFVGRVPAVDDDLQYFVSFSDRRTDVFQVRVFDYPKLERADMLLEFPDYTQLNQKRIEDVRQATAVEGTKVTITCRMNKEVTSAKLVDRNGEELVLARQAGDASMYEVELTLTESRRFRLHLTDEAGRTNKSPPEFVLNATRNRPPELSITQPAGDVRVSPIEELEIAAELSDDFGLVEYGLGYSLGADEPEEVTLGDADPSATRRAEKPEHLIDFEGLEAQPDDLLAYYLWAVDVGPDGKSRRTMSDMYFAEVRHFEEIFREGDPSATQQAQQQQQGQQQGAGQQAQELAELQKQIINAAWNVIRRETAAEPSVSFGDDVLTLEQSQAQVIEQLAALVERLKDPASLHHAEQAEEFMNESLDQFSTAFAEKEINLLRLGMSAAQGAYQSLLRLRAREFDVAQANQQGSSSGTASGSGNRSQQQLNQLELSADQNRYETESSARSANEDAQGAQRDESREILDRLRELARRQQDLNDRLRELQSALQAAEDEQERQRIERELKRLRDQQRQLLEDTDQLQNDMENSQNAQQMRDASEQLQQTRSRVQDAAEALEDGRVPEALTEGTRASRELEDLRDDFRERTAEAFSDEMRELRQAARELDEQQQELSDQLNQLNESMQQSLRSRGPREQFTEGIEQQQQRLNELIERLQQTVQEAEEPEPLLARELYDAVQQSSERKIEEALDVTRQLAEVGVTREASEVMRVANQGVRELREGVGRAAQSVLGDETEALRRAEQSLRDLADELNREIEAATGEQRLQQPGQQAQPGEEQSTQQSQQQEGQPGEGDQPGQQGEGQGEGETDSQRQSQDAQQQGRPQGEQSDQQNQQAQGQQPGQGGGQGGGGEQQSDSAADPSQTAAGGREPQDAQQQQSGSSQSQDGQENQQGAPNRSGQASRDGRPQLNNNGGGGGRGGPGGLEEYIRRTGEVDGPITGEDFRQWSDRMRDVQDILDDPELSAEAARIRDRAELARAEYKRHSKEPDWSKMIKMVADPLTELRQRVTEEIRRREDPDALSPIDRDPVPSEFENRVRIYYEQLGGGR